MSALIQELRLAAESSAATHRIVTDARHGRSYASMKPECTVEWRAAERIAELEAEVSRLTREADGEFVQAAVRVMQAWPGFDHRDYALDGITADDFEEMFTEDMREAWRRSEAARAEVARLTRERDEIAASARAHIARAEAAEADARRYRYLRDHRGYYCPMSHDHPAEWSITWDFQQSAPGEQDNSFDSLIDHDIARRAEADAWVAAMEAGDDTAITPAAEEGR